MTSIVADGAGASRTETHAEELSRVASAEDIADEKAATAHAKKELESFWFADQIAHHPCRVIGIVYCVLILLFIIVASVGFKIDDPGNRDYNIQRAENTRNVNALALVRDMVHGADDAKATAIRSSDGADFLLMVLYRSTSSETLLNVESLRHLQFLENSVQAQCPDGSSAIVPGATCELAAANLDRWPRLCWSGLQTKFNTSVGPPFLDSDYPCVDSPAEKAYDSALRVLVPYLPGGKLTATTTQAQLDTAVAAMAQNAVDTQSELQLSQYFGRGWDASKVAGRKPKYLRSFFRFGRPLIINENERYSDPLDREKDQTALYNKHSNAVIELFDNEGNKAGVETVGAGLQYIQNLFQITSQTDFMWALASMLFVWGYITFHTRSFFLSSMAMLEIALSFPAAYFIYRFIFQVNYFQFAHMLSIFIILGIGADNCFVFHDAFIQSTQEHVELRDPEKLNSRFAYTFRRAATAMFVTTLTTFAAFLVTAISPVIPIATFGMYAAVLVACKYVLVITLFPAVVSFWHLKLRGTKCGCVGTRHVPEDDLHAESLQSGAATPVKGDAPKIVVDRRSSGVQLTSSEARQDEAHSPRQMSESIPMRELESRTTVNGAAVPVTQLEVGGEDLARVHSRVGAADNEEYRPIERFFMNTWSPNMQKYRWHVLAGFFVFFIVCVSLAAQVKPIREQEQWLPTDHVLTKAINWPVDHFPQSEHDQFIEITVLWGTDGIDFSNSPRLNPNALGELELDTKFDPSSVAAQQSIWSFCDTMRKRTDVVFEAEGAVSCWATGYRSWLEAEGLAFPQQPGNFTRSLEEFLATPAGRLFVIRQDVGLLDGKVVYVSASFASNTPLLGSFGAIKDAEVIWRDIVEQYNAGAPAGVNNALQTAGVAWTWIDSQNALFRSSFTGIGLALTMAFIALTVSTMNVIVGLVATLAIGGICTSVMGTIFVIGWEFGFTESVAVVMIIGLSVDYTVHLGNAYVESPRLSRHGRMDDSLRQFGISVVAGGVTTMGSSLFLFGAQLIFFFKFGTAVLLTVIYSWTWALGFFAAAMYAFGPQDQVGSIHVAIEHAKARWAAYKVGVEGAKGAPQPGDRASASSSAAI